MSPPDEEVEDEVIEEQYELLEVKHWITFGNIRTSFFAGETTLSKA